MSETQLSADGKQIVKCGECGNKGVEASDGVCVFCAGPDPEIKAEVREALEALIDEHDLPTVFWSLDAVYDECEAQMDDLTSFEVPIYEATVVVPDADATSGERYDTRRIDGCLTDDAARERVEDDPEVRSVENIEQVDTAEVA